MNMQFDKLPPTKPIGPMTRQWLGDNTVSQDLKDQWINNGFSILRGAYRPDQIARYNKIVASVRTKIDDGKDQHGYGDRIGQLHQKYPELLEMASDDRVSAFLKWAFNDDPVVFASLNFERGTQQAAHIDAIFFWPEPTYSMCGCWVALEDIHPDSGPLFYVPNSHTWPFFRSQDVAATRPELAARRLAARDPAFPADQRAAVVHEMGNAWVEDFGKLEQSYQSERPPISLKAGDVVFWHSLLAHGGSPRINPALSRRSVVFHFIGRKTKLYTFEQFMLHDEAELANQQEQAKDLRKFGSVEYMHYPYFVAYPVNQQVMHPLTETKDA